MKLLITSSLDLEKSANSRLHRFVDYLLTQGHQITVLSVNDHWKARRTDYSKDMPGLEGIIRNINIYHFSRSKMSPYIQELFSFTGINRLLDSIDYRSFDLHFAYNTFISGYLVAKRLGRWDINTIYDVADDTPQMIRTSPQIPAPLRVPGWVMGGWLLRKNFDVAQKVTVIGETLRQFLNVPSDKAQIVPNGVDTDKFRPIPSLELREKLGVAGDFVVGYVGGLREWVDLRSAFEAIAHLRNDIPRIRLMVVGDEGYFAESQTLAQRIGIQDRVLFTGRVPYQEVPQYISCLDVGLIPFKKNRVTDSSSPLKLFEYLACQKPVISTRLAEVEAIMQDRVLYASDSQELSRRIDELYQSQDLRNRLGVEGRGFVTRNYRWSVTTGNLERVLKEVARRDRFGSGDKTRDH